MDSLKTFLDLDFNFAHNLLNDWLFMTSSAIFFLWMLWNSYRQQSFFADISKGKYPKTFLDFWVFVKQGDK